LPRNSRNGLLRIPLVGLGSRQSPNSIRRQNMTTPSFSKLFIASAVLALSTLAAFASSPHHQVVRPPRTAGPARTGQAIDEVYIEVTRSENSIFNFFAYLVNKNRSRDVCVTIGSTLCQHGNTTVEQDRIVTVPAGGTLQFGQTTAFEGWQRS